MHPAPIYLDHNATTPLDPEVLEAMRPYFLTGGNAESRHALGRAARRGLEFATETVARILGANPTEVIFTSGGTEANNLAVFGLAGAENLPAHVVSSPFEHPAVAEPIARLQAAGFGVGYLSVDSQGIANTSTAKSLLQPDTRFATLMLANNETGAVQPVGSLVRQACAQGIPVHTDATQAVGRISVHFHDLGVITLAASAHKFHGPVGVGILLVRDGTRLGSRLFGGGQQQGRRPGTIAVPLVIGLAAALEKWHSQATVRAQRWALLRDRLESGLIAGLGPEHVIRNGPDLDQHRLPQTVNIGFSSLDGDALLMRLDMAGIAVSLGSACASGSTRLSPTLLAMRVPDDRLRSSVRFSFGATTTEGEIDDATHRIVRVVRDLNSAQVSAPISVSLETTNG
jgi:cysteine desulfurase